jgi:hypothetical protein
MENVNEKPRPWNKGKLIGAKPPLRPKYVWSIRTRLQLEGRKRDLALFNLAIDSKLRGCDVVSMLCPVQTGAMGHKRPSRTWIFPRRTVTLTLGELRWTAGLLPS